MKAQTVHMTDKMLCDVVIAQLDFEPEVNPAGIGMAAEDGVVTLSEFVDDYAQKVAAEKAVKRVFGVKGVANELMVRMVCASGLAVTPAITAGDPKQALLDEADAWGADCLFIGARGHNRLVRFMLGSLATAVVGRARCSVEVVRMKKSV